MIGEIIQYILDKGFYLRYEYDPKSIFGERHIFTMRKYCGERVYEGRWCLDWDIAKYVNAKEVVFTEVEYCMKQIDDAMTPYRLIEESLQ